MSKLKGIWARDLNHLQLWSLFVSLRPKSIQFTISMVPPVLFWHGLSYRLVFFQTWNLTFQKLMPKINHPVGVWQKIVRAWIVFMATDRLYTPWSKHHQRLRSWKLRHRKVYSRVYIRFVLFCKPTLEKESTDGSATICLVGNGEKFQTFQNVSN